jgi:glycosyltransferase involved in cell wall biosynthesis
VGLIFLDHRFTIPNFPSRLLSYMENGMPVLAVTDPNSDVGQIATKGGFGWWCESNDALSFTKTVDLICSQKDQIKSMGQRARAYLEENYTVDTEYEIITKHFK